MVNASVERLSQRARDDAAAYRSHLHLVPPTGRILVRQPSANLSAMVKRLKLVQRRYNYTAAMGNSWQVAGEPCALERLGTSPSAFDGREIETVCEIGFNGATPFSIGDLWVVTSPCSLALLACCSHSRAARSTHASAAGHSASALLMHNNAVLHEFDVQSLKWSKPCLAEVRKRFPGRVILHQGDSRREGPAFAKRVSEGLERPCDVFFIDGHHSNPHVQIDFTTAINATRPGGMIMADDTSALFKTVLKMWLFHTARGDIIHPRCAYPVRKQSIGLRSFCFGVRAPSASHTLSREWYRDEQRKNGTWARWLRSYDPKAAWRYHVARLANATAQD